MTDGDIILLSWYTQLNKNKSTWQYESNIRCTDTYKNISNANYTSCVCESVLSKCKHGKWKNIISTVIMCV